VSVRVDKWLQVARVFKTRSQAGRACQLGRVSANGTVCKAHRKLAIDDLLEIRLGDWTRVLVVKELADKPLPKAEAPRLYEDTSPPPPVRDPLQRLLARPASTREAGAGRPEKRDRRRLDDLRGR